MEKQFLVIDSLMCWQGLCAPQEGRGGAAWTHEGSDPHGHSVGENDIHEKLNTI
jgi:hypothetical protein